MSSLSILSQLLLQPGPKDAVGSSLLQRLNAIPYVSGPKTWPAPLNLIPTSFYELSLQAWVPIIFSLVYYIVSHSANHFFVGSKHKGRARDYTKGDGSLSKVLRFLVITHNAFLAVYSGWTFYHTTPVALRFLLTGYRAAGIEGLKLALCSIPINTITLAPYTYLFYISKYYEVVDSMILVLKGKTVSNLQSYHHAGALLAMWVAYRFQNQAVWVFVTFNSGVHTAMYSYYFCAAMKLPFPKALKRNLTTLQILQITSGTLLTNLYWIIELSPTTVVTGLTKLGFSEAARNPTQVASDLLRSTASSSYSAGYELFQIASQRATSRYPAQCLESAGSALALHFNTAYLLPLVVLFIRFFIRSYTTSNSSSNNASSKATGSSQKVNKLVKAEKEAEEQLQETDVPRTPQQEVTTTTTSVKSKANGNGTSSSRRR